jgi:hypothetical protein
LTADLSLWSLQFNLVDMMQVPLCDATMVANANNQNDCPGDGSMDYSITYKLPNAGSEATSWLASGWQGSGLVQMYAQQDESMKIGECVLELKTYVTQKSTEKNLIGTPSAAVTAGIVVAVAAVLSLLFLYCVCCRRKKANDSSNKTVAVEEGSHFKRMEDDKSYWSGSKKTHVTAASQSVVSDLPSP